MTLRHRFFAPLVPVLLTACSLPHFTRGLPTVAKSPEGLLIRDTQSAPDIQRGNQARLAGRMEDAERDLRPLAERGYPDAQVYLAAIYALKESAQAQDLAIKWYRAALRSRPEAAIPLARVFMRRSDRASAAEAERLLSVARHRHLNPAADAALLDLYALYPQLDTKGQAPALAQSAAKSDLPQQRISAINWYRASLDEPANARRLIELCPNNLEVAPACYVDLALFYRYSNDRAALEKLLERALTTWQEHPPVESLDETGAAPVLLPPIAGQLAISMVNQPLDQELADSNEDLDLTSQIEVQLAAMAADGNADDVLLSPLLDSAADSEADPAAGSPAEQTESAAQAEPSPASAESTQPSVAASADVLPSNAQPELANRILRWMLKQPGAMPAEAAGVAVSFPYLLADVDLEKVLKAGADAGFPRAWLYLGQLYYFNQRAPRNAILGEASFERCLQYRETSIRAHYRLGRLYQQGYLGRPDPQKALEHFLYAARNRITAADTQLARLFYDTPGAKINRVNAYVFAQLSEDAGMPVVIRTLHGGTLNSYKLVDRLRADLTENELRKATALYEQERAVHLVSRAPVSPHTWTQAAKP